MSGNGKVYEVVITETAWEQMIEHARFMAQVSATAANRLVGDFVKCCDTLGFMPERCAWLQNNEMPYQKYRKILFGKFHMALFLIKDETVYVTAVVDCRRGYGWLG